MKVELVYALPMQQKVYDLDVQDESNIAAVLQQSPLFSDFPELALQTLVLGIWGKRADLEQIVQAGDRIEIYRPLQIDPKQARQLLVGKERAKQKTGPFIRRKY